MSSGWREVPQGSELSLFVCAFHGRVVTLALFHSPSRDSPGSCHFIWSYLTFKWDEIEHWASGFFFVGGVHLFVFFASAAVELCLSSPPLYCLNREVNV